MQIYDQQFSSMNLELYHRHSIYPQSEWRIEQLVARQPPTWQRQCSRDSQAKVCSLVVKYDFRNIKVYLLGCAHMPIILSNRWWGRKKTWFVKHCKLEKVDLKNAAMKTGAMKTLRIKYYKVIHKWYDHSTKCTAMKWHVTKWRTMKWQATKWRRTSRICPST